MALLSALMTEIAIPVCAFLGIAYSLGRWLLKSHNSDSRQTECDRLKKNVSEGVKSFLFTEYCYVGVFVVAFGILLILFLGSVESFSTQSRPCTFDPSKTCKPALATAVFSTVSFLLGVVTSVLSGFLGTKFTIYANARTDLEEGNFVRRTSIAAFRSGEVMGFLLAAMGLLVLYLAINLFKLYYGDDWEGLFEAITGYGLGGSCMALFGRASGGIYAKAADVCVHLVEEIERHIPQNFRNPAVVSNNVGNVVGDIAGMGADFFGSYAESSCAALAVASISSFGIVHDFTAMCYPLLISSTGILFSLITTLFTAYFFEIVEVQRIKPALEKQLLISTILMTIGIAIVSWIALPSSFTIYNFRMQKVVKNWQLFSCVGVGLWARHISWFVLEYYTNNPRCLVQDGAGSFGLAHVIVPIFAIAISIFVSFSFAATYGIAVAAIGMLSTVATGLAIDAYCPISHSARGIAKTAGLNNEYCQRIDDLDAAGNAIAAIGKGFTIGSAVLMSLALIGAFVSRAAIPPVDILTPKVFIGLIVGAILPYQFSDMTMKIVGRAGLEMADWVLNQDISGHRDCKEYPRYAELFKISTVAAIRSMILPGALVMLTPLIVGTLFGVEMLSGVLAGSLVSVVWIATSVSYTGGPWHNARQSIRAGALEHARTLSQKLVLPSEAGREDAIDGNSQMDASGAPLNILIQLLGREDAIDGNSQKDTSGAPLNILIQLMAVESLVFAPFFATYGGLLFKIFLREGTDDFPFVAAAASS